ncbi:TetR/AcrR family transcriptional regulator [Actinomycetospora straminea]|uniref:TetR/AcrR family transcriptional regulator n=1 Tax=Actinomycetospora straminea TaxID=663607 RepID=A0ABP9F6T7_9PSEU|nr:TetR/AcrR family transcriptional regulator [Actinomycetospora straminea]MDD7931864.1 helix-turn-helix domain containing protein [Actinomycetospora straminea]
MNLDAAPSFRELMADTGDAAAPGPPPSRRTRGRTERRDRVFEAAVALFGERGFEETSMDDIAARAGLARTTVFNHFPRKTAFLEEWTLRRRERAARSFRDTGGAHTVRTVLGSYFRALAEVNVETRAETAALMPLAVKQTDILVDHPLARDLAEIVEDAGEPLAGSASPQRVGWLLALGYFSAVTRWVAVDPAPFDLAVELAAILDTVLGGALAAEADAAGPAR